MDELVWEIKNGELEQVQTIFSQKDININEEINGRYPVHYAADYGQSDVLAFLISKGADLNVKDKHGITPLLAAIWEGHVECVRLLLANGALKTETAPDGTSYIDSAEKNEIREMLK